jgi:hypothetical protein
VALQVERESKEALKKWGLGLSKILESCFFCGRSTDT